MPTGVYPRTKKWKWSEEAKKNFSESMKGQPRKGDPKRWKFKKHKLSTPN